MMMLALVPATVEAQARKTGKVVGGLERLLYVTDRSGMSVYDINDGHKLKIRERDERELQAAKKALGP